MNKLLYIHPLGLDGADMVQRSDLARSLGFDVISMPNEPFFAPEIEAELAEYVVRPECAGIWADVEADQLNDAARNLLLTAGMVDKPLLGRQRFGSEIVKNLVAIIGIPTVEGPSIVPSDNDLDNSAIQDSINATEADGELHNSEKGGE